MRKYFKSKKIVTLTISVLATTLILTGTFAWSLTLFSTTGGLGEEFHYLVKLLDEDSDPLFVNNNWKSGTIDKKVYATSSYTNEDIAKQYKEITDDNSDSIFKDAWVRIKLEETFMRNGITLSETVKKLNQGKLISSYNQYFTFDVEEQVSIITLDTWIENISTIEDYQMKGRFWILDEDSGWLYWAQPLLATTYVDGSNPELADQTTDHIMDVVDLKAQPTGVWEYTIKATLEAMDVELTGYTNEGAWNDISYDHPIYSLIEIEDVEAAVLTIDEESFPNEAFRTWVIDHVAGAENKKLTTGELKKITNLNISNQGFNDVTGIENFTNLISLDASNNKLTTIDVSNNTALQYLFVNNNHLGYLDVSELTHLVKTDANYFKYLPQYHLKVSTVMESTQTNDSTDIKEWYVPEFDAAGNVLVNSHNFPDPIFLDYIKNNSAGDQMKGYGKDGILTTAELENVINIFVESTGISDLTGIEHFTKLTQIYGQFNNLRSIDVRKNPLLVTLLINDNYLTNVDVSKNPGLIYLRVHGNLLRELDVTNQTMTLKANNETFFNYKVQYVDESKVIKLTYSPSSTANIKYWY